MHAKERPAPRETAMASGPGAMEPRRPAAGPPQPGPGPSGAVGTPMQSSQRGPVFRPGQPPPRPPHAWNPTGPPQPRPVRLPVQQQQQQQAPQAGPPQTTTGIPIAQQRHAVLPSVRPPTRPSNVVITPGVQQQQRTPRPQQRTNPAPTTQPAGASVAQPQRPNPPVPQHARAVLSRSNTRMSEQRRQIRQTRLRIRTSRTTDAIATAPTRPAARHPRRANAELKFCKQVLEELCKTKHRACAFPFYEPVDPVALNIPDYFDIIKNPMDISTMSRKITNNEYNGLEEFESDVRLMFNNCYTYNPADTHVYKMGKLLEQVFDAKWTDQPSHEQPAPRYVLDINANYSAEHAKVNAKIQKLINQITAVGYTRVDFEDARIARRTRGRSPVGLTAKQKVFLSKRLANMTDAMKDALREHLDMKSKALPTDEETTISLDELTPQLARKAYNWLKDNTQNQNDDHDAARLAPSDHETSDSDYEDTTPKKFKRRRLVRGSELAARGSDIVDDSMDVLQTSVPGVQSTSESMDASQLPRVSVAALKPAIINGGVNHQTAIKTNPTVTVATSTTASAPASTSSVVSQAAEAKAPPAESLPFGTIQGDMAEITRMYVKSFAGYDLVEQHKQQEEERRRERERVVKYFEEDKRRAEAQRQERQVWDNKREEDKKRLSSTSNYKPPHVANYKTISVIQDLLGKRRPEETRGADLIREKLGTFQRDADNKPLYGSWRD